MMKKNIVQIFSDNLNRLLKNANISQYKLAKDINVNKGTVSYWLSGKSYPKHESMQKLADYLGVSISELTDEQPDIDDNKEHFYPDPETRKTLEELRTNDELKMLFDAARTASPEDLKAAHALILALKSKEKPEQ